MGGVRGGWLKTLMEKERDKLNLILDRLNSAMAWSAAVAILFMMFAISYAVMMRYVWNKPVPWIVEISSYLMLYITFLGTAWLQRKGGHVEVDLFTGRLKPRTRWYMTSSMKSQRIIRF